MFIGEYFHTADPKGRVIFPAKIREELGERFYITKGLDNCLAVYKEEEWAKIQEKILTLPNAKSRNLKRFLFSSAAEVRADKQSRVLIPQNLREYAGLERDIVIIGASSNVEIWDKERWESVCTELTPDMIAEAMDELDF